MVGGRNTSYHSASSFHITQAADASAQSSAEYDRQVAQHRDANTLVPRQLAVPDAERIARKKKRRRRRWERQQKAAAEQPVRVLEGYTAVPSPVAIWRQALPPRLGLTVMMMRRTTSWMRSPLQVSSATKSRHT